MVKSKFPKIFLIPLILIIGVIVFGLQNTFIGSNNVVLSEDTKGLYQYTGDFGTSYTNGRPTCMPVSGQQIISESYLISDIATIKTLSHTYQIETSGFERGSKISGGTCSDNFYLAKVKQDGVLIDTLDFTNPPSDCLEVKSLDVERSYDELNVVFGDNQLYAGQKDGRGGCSQALTVVHSYELNYPQGTIETQIQTKELKDNEIIVDFTIDNKAHDILADIELNLDSGFGKDVNVFSETKTLKTGETNFVVSIPVSSSQGEITFKPKLTAYASTDRLSGLMGQNTWRDNKDGDSVRWNSHNYYFVGEFKGNTQKVTFGDNEIETVEEVIGDNEIETVEEVIIEEVEETQTETTSTPSSQTTTNQTQKAESNILTISIIVIVLILLISFITLLVRRRRKKY